MWTWSPQNFILTGAHSGITSGQKCLPRRYPFIPLPAPRSRLADCSRSTGNKTIQLEHISGPRSSQVPEGLRHWGGTCQTPWKYHSFCPAIFIKVTFWAIMGNDLWKILVASHLQTDFCWRRWRRRFVNQDFDWSCFCLPAALLSEIDIGKSSAWC